MNSLLASTVSLLEELPDHKQSQIATRLLVLIEEAKSEKDDFDRLLESDASQAWLEKQANLIEEQIESGEALDRDPADKAA